MVQKLEQEPGPFISAEIPVSALCETMKDIVVLLTDRHKEIRRHNYPKRYRIVLSRSLLVIDRNIDKNKDVIVFYFNTGGFFRVQCRSYKVLRSLC